MGQTHREPQGVATTLLGGVVMGKGDYLLPVFFHANCTAALNMLADSNVREKVGVSNTNRFLFAYFRDENEEIKKQLKKCVNWRERRSRPSGGRVWEGG